MFCVICQCIPSLGFIGQCVIPRDTGWYAPAPRIAHEAKTNVERQHLGPAHESIVDLRPGHAQNKSSKARLSAFTRLTDKRDRLQSVADSWIDRFPHNLLPYLPDPPR